MRMESDTSIRSEEAQKTEATFGKWALLVCAVWTYGVSLGLPVSLSIMFLDWQETFQVSRARTAVVHATCVGFLLGGSVIPGYIMHKFGARVTVLFGSVLSSVGFVLSMFATSIDFLTVTAGCIGGIGCCFIQMTTIPSITLVFDKYRSVTISLCTVFSAVVLSIFPAIYSFLVEQYSWRGVFGVMAAIIINTSVSGMIMTSFEIKRPKSTVLTDHLPGDSACALIKLPNETSLSITKGHCEGGDSQTAQNKRNLVIIRDAEKNDKVIQYPEQEIDAVEGFPLTNHAKSEALLQTQTTPLSKYSKSNNMLESVKNSKWKFLLDYIYILLLAHTMFCLANIFCFPLLLTDFCKTKGFSESAGRLFFSALYFTSIGGRILVAFLNLNSHFHSIYLYAGFSILNMLCMILLILTEDYLVTLIYLCLYGLCFGAVISIQLKCVVDIKSVDTQSHPLAIGLVCTVEGLMDLLMPALMGYSVDVTGSYSLILGLMGTVGFIISIMFAAGFWIYQRKYGTTV